MIGSRLGRMWRTMIRQGVDPITREAVMNSRGLSESTSARTMRAAPGNAETPMKVISSGTFDP